MILSANEVSSTVLKAARAAGVPLSQAEDLSRAAPLLTENLAGLLAALEGPFGAVEMRDGIIEDARAVVAGPAALDWVAVTGEAVQLRSCDAVDVVSALAASAGSRVVVDGQDVTVSRGDVEAVTPTRCEVDARLWARVERLAARVYVPASAASRANAGAGETDND